MNAELQSIFDSVPKDEPRSRVEPYRELILRWRREGRSYRKICKLLSESCGLEIRKSALHEFVERRARPRKLQPELPTEPTALSATTEHGRLSLEERIAQRDAIRAAYIKPVVPQEAPKKLFVYDPDKPPINKNY